MARVEKSGQFEPAHLARWLETTRYDLFADLERLVASFDDCFPPLQPEELRLE
ncbi:MAG: hypothetical protein PHD37_02145 [Gallionellaceae bacterium]|nr:hypothetical protein [Gallionellaceae bacterium]